MDRRTIAHYEILEEIGAGGMGVVYRARDTRLDREVAVKALPEGLAQDAERLARFEREAKLLASLNHPHIAAIHGLEKADGQPFLILELVEGETLAKRIARGPVPVEEALELGRQIAEALEAAHERGVVHRDLKPANVKVTPEGQVKILDFGLAKAWAPQPTGGDFTQSPTLTAQMTGQGVLLGTATYMSPEQVRGQEADKRADIWAFGCVLYEMLTGRRMFAGDTVSDILAAVLRADPEWDELPATTPRAIRRLLHRCLARDPDRRLHDMADARIEIEDALAGEEEPSRSEVVAAPAPQPVWGRLLPWALVGGLALLAGWLAQRSKVPEPEMPLRKLEIAEMEEVSLFGFGLGGMISPDGSSVAYVSDGKLRLRRLEEFEPREIPGSNFESTPFWSPDSRWLAYPAGRTLWKVPVVGGEPKAITDLPTNVGPFGGSWGKDGHIVLTTGYSGLLEVSAQGGDLREVLAPDTETEADFHHASLLPEGKGVLFGIHYKNRPEGPLAVWDGESRKVLLEVEGLGFETPVYSPSGHILFVRRPTSFGIWAVPFSLDDLEITGEPFILALDAHSPSVAADGTLVFIRGVEEEMRELVWLDRSGRELGVAGVAQPGIREFALSPQGDLVVLSASEGNSRELWIQDLERGTKNQLTFSPDEIRGSSFSPDGQHVAYFVQANDPRMYVVDIEGRQEPIDLGPGGRPSWSWERNLLVYEIYGARGLWYMELGEDGAPGEPQLILDAPGDESEPVLSPDGRLLAYSSDESGRFEVYLTRFPSGEGKWQVSSEGGALPRWSPSEDELFYMDGEGNLLGVRVVSGSSPRTGAPVLLFSGRSYGLGGDREYVPAEDGTRFLLARSVSEDREKLKLLLVQNWFAEFEGNH